MGAFTSSAHSLSTGGPGAASEPRLPQLPPEVLLQVLRPLDAAALCSVARACRSLEAVALDCSLWRRLSLTLCSAPWPPRAPRALRCLRVCSHRASPAAARRALIWLRAGGLRSVHRLELVGRHLHRDTLRLCVRLCGVRELSLHDVHVQDEWLPDLASLRTLQVLHIDWNTEMSSHQMLQLTAACPDLRLIDTGGCPADSKAAHLKNSLCVLERVSELRVT